MAGKKLCYPSLTRVIPERLRDKQRLLYFSSSRQQRMTDPSDYITSLRGDNNYMQTDAIGKRPQIRPCDDSVDDVVSPVSQLTQQVDHIRLGVLDTGRCRL